MEDKVTIEFLESILEDAKKDYIKTYEKNNKAASVRLRKKLSFLAKHCKIARKEIMEHINSTKKGS